MSILFDNLKKAHNSLGWSQGKAASNLSIKRSRIASYEEDWAQPSVKLFPKIVDVYAITDWKGFITNPNCDPAQRHPSSTSAPHIKREYEHLKHQLKTN